MAYIGEIVGTAIMVLLGNGVVANTNLNKSKFKGSGPVQITIGWGLAVMVPAIIFFNISGAHFNPAVTIALAIANKFSWTQVVPYIISQFIGAMLGALIVYIFFKDQFDATENEEIILGCFANAPAVYNLKRNFFCEMTATFLLVFFIMSLSQNQNFSIIGENFIFIYAIITSIGMSLGGVTGYSINPARDLGPRIIHAILPIKNKGKSLWSYSWVPVFGPIVGGILGCLLYLAIF